MFDSSEKEHVLPYGNNAPKQARGRLVKAGANRTEWGETPGYIVIILVLGFYDSRAKEVLPGQNG